MADFRSRMFEEMGARDPARVEAMARAFVPYAEAAMPRGELLGWVAEADGEAVGGIAAVLQTMPPSLRNPCGTTGYILNLYVLPPWRRQGIARQLVETAVDALRDQGVGGATLHASDAGRPLYERMGFVASSEMRLFFDEDAYDPYGPPRD